MGPSPTLRVSLQPSAHTPMHLLRKQVCCFLRNSLRDCCSQRETTLRTYQAKEIQNSYCVVTEVVVVKCQSTNKQRCLNHDSAFHSGSPPGTSMPDRLFTKYCLLGILSSMLLFASLAPSQVQIIAHHNPSN